MRDATQQEERRRAAEELACLANALRRLAPVVWEGPAARTLERSVLDIARDVGLAAASLEA
ncbi:MAG: hypothetical protein JWP66_520 [Naasia sp.]|nr:hypothetical protein [Naasia sp.]